MIKSTPAHHDTSCNPAHHDLHEFDGTTRDLYVPRPNGRGGMTWPATCPIGLKAVAAMTSAEIKVELVCPLITPSFPPGMHDYNLKRHNLIEGESKCMITKKEPKAKFNEYHETQGSHDEVYTDGLKMNEGVGGSSLQPQFPEWWSNLPPPIEKTARYQHHVCCWSYSHHPGTELLPVHGLSSWRCSSLLWLNVLLTGDRGQRLLFAISGTSSGYWGTEAHVSVSTGYGVIVVQREMKESTS